MILMFNFDYGKSGSRPESVNFFFHGLDSSHRSTKYAAIPAPKCCIDMDFSKPDEMIDLVLDSIQPNDIFIGHSFGALWALAAAGETTGKCLLINPSFRPIRFSDPHGNLELNARYASMYDGAMKYSKRVTAITLIEDGDEIVDQRPNIELCSKFSDAEVFPGGYHRFSRVDLIPSFISRLRYSFAEKGTD